MDFDASSFVPKPTSIDGKLPEHLMKLPNRISDLFIGKSVFITGGSGFMGKVLVEKILRKCPQVKNIYLLLRPKKGKTPEQRITELFESPVFDLLKSMHGKEIVKKVICIPGDLVNFNFGLSWENRCTLFENVEFFYHMAATVRFDVDLKMAVFWNTRGTKYAIQLGRQMKKLELFMYVSTAYCHPEETYLLEIAYRPPADPEKIIQMMELMDDDVVKYVEKRLLGKFPNTYVYTKSLAEDIVVKAYEGGDFPAAIVRPSIVIPIWKEPLPGWTDNINGPVGLLIGAGKGVIRTMYCNSDAYADFLPVDMAINGIMVFTWSFLKTKKPLRPIYNLTSSEEWKVTWQEIIDIGKSIVTKDVPLNGAVWYPGGSLKKNKTIHKICVFLLHTLPAYFLDFFIYISGNRPVLRHVQGRINKGFEMFEYYANNQWRFEMYRIKDIRVLLNEREKLEYKADGDGMNIREYFTDCIKSCRIHLLKESPDTIPAARRHMKIMWVVDLTAKLIFFIWMFSWLIGGFRNYLQAAFGADENVTPVVNIQAHKIAQWNAHQKPEERFTISS